MAQELMAKPRTFRGTFDQARYVGNHEAAVLVHPHHAEIWMQRRKWIIGDFWPGRGDGTDICGLSGIRHAEQAHVREHFQLKLQTAAFARRAGRELAGRSIGAGFEMDIAQAPLSAFRQHSSLTVSRKVREHFAGLQVGHYSTDRDTQSDIVRCLAVTIGSAAFFAITCAVNTGIAKLNQCIDVAVGDCEDRTSTAPVAAVRPPPWYELLPPEARAAIPAFPGVDFNNRFVDEFHDELESWINTASLVGQHPDWCTMSFDIQGPEIKKPYRLR